MTFDELLAEAEARRAERRAYVAVNFIPRFPRRGVRLSTRPCGCAMCGEVGDVCAALREVEEAAGVGETG